MFKDDFLSVKFENSMIEVLENLNVMNFKVNLQNHKLFVCGGLVDGTAFIPPSFRDRFISYTASNQEHIHDSIVLAESFKDYFKENAYPDLLVFEDEIASIASLVVIFLESPGSLVELGMFCTKPNFYKKLLIIAPQEEIQAEDSFIYLGPLENIRKKEETSIAIYPWPNKDVKNYDEDHLIDLCDIVNNKIASIPKNVRFDQENTGHITLLISELIRLFYPIIVSEIEISLMSIELDIPLSTINRYIYLLMQLKIIGCYSYSGYKYYYPMNKNLIMFKFGMNKKGASFDESKVQMMIKQSYILDENEPASRKRKTALKEINKILSEVA